MCIVKKKDCYDIICSDVLFAKIIRRVVNMLVNTHIHTVRDLVLEAAREYNDKDYLRFIENEEIKGVSFK